MSFIPNKVERDYINRLLELKPNCTGKEMLRLLCWCNKYDMKRIDSHFKRDDFIKEVIKHKTPFE